MRTHESKLRDEVVGWLEQCDARSLFELRSDAVGQGGNLLTIEQDSERCSEYLSYGLPREKFSQGRASSDRVFWFPNGVPDGAATLVASSRIGSQPDCKPEVFDAIRTLAYRFDTENRFLVTHDTMATHRFISRAAELFDLPIVELRPFPAELDADWFLKAREELTGFVCYYDRKQDEWEGSFQVDRFVVSLAREVRLLEVRKHGNVHKAISDRLEQSEGETSVFLLADGRLNSSNVTEPLTELGAVPWFLYREDLGKPVDTAADAAVETMKTDSIIRLETFAESITLDDFLIHWTRRRKGPWPDQSENRYLDDLILGTFSAKHDRLRVLARILATKRLIATNQLTRDRKPVVCFSEVTVDRIGALRQFRAHLGRWDFETVGIAIRRSVVERCGGRKVVYGEESDWIDLPEIDRPYFQKQKSGAIDWTAEQEWRVVGDFGLSRLGTDDAFVFVDSEIDAGQIASLCNWPVVVIE